MAWAGTWQVGLPMANFLSYGRMALGTVFLGKVVSETLGHLGLRPIVDEFSQSTMAPDVKILPGESIETARNPLCADTKGSQIESTLGVVAGH